MVRFQRAVWGTTLGLCLCGMATWGATASAPIETPVLRTISARLPQTEQTGRASTEEPLSGLVPSPKFSPGSLARLERRWAQKDGAAIWWTPFILRAVNFDHLYPPRGAGLFNGSGR